MCCERDTGTWNACIYGYLRWVTVHLNCFSHHAPWVIHKRILGPSPEPLQKSALFLLAGIFLFTNAQGRRISKDIQSLTRIAEECCLGEVYLPHWEVATLGVRLSPGLDIQQSFRLALRRWWWQGEAEQYLVHFRSITEPVFLGNCSLCRDGSFSTLASLLNNFRQMWDWVPVSDLAMLCWSSLCFCWQGKERLL